MIALWFIGIIGLFSTGAGGRHDWMRFHATQVPCPKENCYGDLKWADGAKTIVICGACHTRFRVKEMK